MANVLLPPPPAPVSRGRSRTELALLTSLFSLFLSLSVPPLPQRTTEESRCCHSVVHTAKDRRLLQRMKATLALLVVPV